MTDSLKQRLQEHLKDAMRSGETARRDTIRLLISEVKKKEIDIRRELGDAEEQQVLQTQAKQRRESIDQFQSAGRDDLVEKEQIQLDIIEAYLPQQMTDEELSAFIDDGVAQTGATGPRDMGKLMGLLTTSTGGRVDGRRLADAVKHRLTQLATDQNLDSNKAQDGAHL